MSPGQAPVRQSEDTLAHLIERLFGWVHSSGQWPMRIFGTKIEPIEDET